MEFFNSAVDKADDKLEQITGLIASKSEFIVKQVVNSALLFIILIVFGCLDFATLTFHGEYLLTASYWGTIGTKLIAAICAFNIGINMMMDNEIQKSVELKNNIETYNKLIQLKDIDFEYYVIHIFNIKLKKLIYKNSINKQIYRLNKLSRPKDRLLYSSTLPENEEKKKKNWYCKRRAELEELKSDEYIDKNINSLKVKFREIDPAVFELEINGAQKIKSVKVTGNLAVGRARESSIIMFSIVLLSMLTTTFGLTADQQQFESQMVAFWHYCLKAIEDVGIVLWQFINGTLRTRYIVSSQITNPYANRNKVLKEYLEWHTKNQTPKSNVFKELEKEKSNEYVVEVTEEQLKELTTKKDAQ